MLIAKMLLLVLAQSCAGRHLEADLRDRSRHITPEVRIINGDDAKPHALPSMVFLDISRGTRSHICGGSLVHVQFVLTAAHCVQNATAVKNVALGVHNYNHSDAHQNIGVSKFAFHPDYTGTSSHDVAIIKLKEPAKIQAGMVETVDLPDPATFPDRHATYDGKRVTMYGWGRTTDILFSNPRVLQTLEAEAVPYSQCAQWESSEKDALCVGRANAKPGLGCYGDSGSPLMQADVQIGVASKIAVQTSPLCRDSMFTVYARVDYNRKWITQTIDSL